MAAEYREHIEDARLVAAVNHVRTWLFPKESKEPDAGKDRGPIKRQPKPKRAAVKSIPQAAREPVAEAPPLHIVG